MWLLYIYSDILSFLVFYVFRYRKKVVFKNLKNSFPEKSEKEIFKIARKYYTHLTDITLESFKGFTMTEKNLHKRYKLNNKELNIKHYQNGQNIIFATAHYGNWEWALQVVQQIIKHKVAILYKPIKNKKLDTFIKKARLNKGKGMLYSIRSTPRAFLNHERPFSVIMLGDQNPSDIQKSIWVDFLNQPTACLHGIEFYARRYNTIVVFGEFRKIKRGYYEIVLDTITENIKEEEYGQITKKYMNKLEEIILAKPENWLWSHKRWKHKFNPEDHKIIK